MLSRIICLIVISSCLFGCSKNDTAPVQSNDSTKTEQSDSSAWKIDGYTLIWQDEFEGPQVDASKWVCEIGNNNGWGNNELEYYTNRPENVKIDNGNLIITAKKESYSGKDYTSARLKTQGKFSCRYGKIESRIKLPYGQGIWPAFWMLGNNISTVGWPKCGEIDIMEMIGGSGTRDNTVYGTAHWADEKGAHVSNGKNYLYPGGKFSDDYHRFALMWDEEKMIWLFDDIWYFIFPINSTTLSAFQKNQFMLLNLAVGGNWPGNPDGTTVFPQTMTVDYVRVYQLQTTGVKENNSVKPEEFSLEQNYPNPFNPATTIKFNTATEGFVTLKVYDIMGRETALLINEHKPAGQYEAKFDALNIPSGIYYYTLTLNSADGKQNYSDTKKMILLK